MNITVCQIPVKGEQGDLWIGVFLHCFLILLDICVSIMYKHADLPLVQFLTLLHEHDLAGYIPRKHAVPGNPDAEVSTFRDIVWVKINHLIVLAV